MVQQHLVQKHHNYRQQKCNELDNKSFNPHIMLLNINLL